MFHYIYKTVNPKNGKYYIGKHTTNDLNDGYQGSGKWVRDCLKTKTLIETTIIQMCNNEDEAYKLEEKLIEENINKKLCMNMTYGGIGYKSGEKNPWFGKKRSNETKRKISLKNSGINHGMYGKKNSEFHKQRMKEVHTGKKHSEEWKKYMRKINMGENNPMYNKTGYWLGKKLSEDHIQKIKLGIAKKKGLSINV